MPLISLNLYPKLVDPMQSFSKTLNYLFIIIGAVVAIYAQAGEQQDTTVLVVGIMMLMVGIYRISRNIGDKPKGPDGFIKTETDVEERKNPDT